MAEPVPVADAALFKAAIGIKYALRHAEVSRYDGRDALGTYPSAASLWNYIDRERLLIGDGQVCAGPEMMIRELLDVLVKGGGSQAPDSVGLDIGKLLAYADLLAVRETAALLARARERELPGEHRLAELCRRMFVDVSRGGRQLNQRGAGVALSPCGQCSRMTPSGSAPNVHVWSNADTLPGAGGGTFVPGMLPIRR